MNDEPNIEILIHSDTYLGLDYTSDDLQHWKYIKKERVNGKWVYYYKDDIGDNLRSEATRNGLNAAASSQRLKQLKAQRTDTYNRLHSGKLSSTLSDRYFKEVRDLSNNIRKEESRKLDNEAAAKAAADKYNKYNKKTAVKRVAQYTLAKALNAASSSVYNGKKLLKKLFK